MWASAQAADTQTAWQQVNAWRRTHDLLLHHAGRLKACADELEYAWPPGRSPAAQAFVAYITELRTAILEASADAATNYTAIAGVLTSLSAAKADMAKLVQKWETFENAETAEKALRSSSGSSNSPETLNTEARSRMARNDQEVLEASRRFVELAPSARRTGSQGAWERIPGNSDGSDSASYARVGENPSISRMAAPSIDPVELIDRQIGLAGSSVSPTLPGSADPSTLGLKPAASASPQAPVSLPGVGVSGGIPPVRASASADSGRSAQPSRFHPARGGVPRLSPDSPLVVGPNRGQGKVNPVGGVIEAGRPGSPASALPFMGGARNAAQSNRNSVAPLTLHWEVPEGVSPVIEPVPERPFELGPGVIGIDR